MRKDINRIRYAKYYASLQESKISFMGISALQKESFSNSTNTACRLILFNSGHVWDDVINQLQKATGFDLINCEQIAIIAHTKGKAVVKSGDIEELEIINNILKEIRLITTIE